MTKVGLTGGIGSGKSTVSRLMAMLGVAIYDSDSHARALMNSSELLRGQITELLGAGAYRNGELDRSYVASRVFADNGALSALNAIVHPAVAEDFLRWADEQSSPYVILESAILFQSGFDRFVDKVVVVQAPVELRIERVCRRDGTTRQAVSRRIAAQGELSNGDMTITADEKSLLWPQVLEIDKKLRQ